MGEAGRPGRNVEVAPAVARLVVPGWFRFGAAGGEKGQTRDEERLPSCQDRQAPLFAGMRDPTTGDATAITGAGVVRCANNSFLTSGLLIFQITPSVKKW